MVKGFFNQNFHSLANFHKIENFTIQLPKGLSAVNHPNV
jgi:hypothetical protein